MKAKIVRALRFVIRLCGAIIRFISGKGRSCKCKQEKDTEI